MANLRDHMGRPIVAVTGIGVVTSLGVGKADNWAALTSGKSGIHPITRFPVDHLNTRISGMVDFLPSSSKGASPLTYELAETAAQEAVSEAGLDSGDFGGPLFLASPPVELDWADRFSLYNSDKKDGGSERLLRVARAVKELDIFETTQFGSIADRLADRFGTRGLPITLSTACASGATAIQLGVEAIRRGECDKALSIGADGSATAEALIRFSLLSALSTHNDIPEKASKPFSKDRDGFVLAEGSGALVLESLEAALARGATVLGIMRGCGEKADDFHRTRSKPDGSPAIAAVRAALADAGLGEDEIDYVNAHGTSTPENDKMEHLSLSTVFGERIGSMPISSNKSMIGHTLSAAGAVEAAFSLMTMRESVIPPTINYDNPDPAIVLDVVPNKKRNAEVGTVLSNSFGFGGQNTCLVMAREPV
ncbi:beta-ketoacyl-ACP synthase [Mesorhizobium sp. M1C.F.Ca.ET.193.01.1.1]|uniref:beta-ketoacyl-ACP synthase n=1 Tax=unclassified Mesorhizobium TaxID=325217 RepID=UPI000FD2736B|nr:MULTISPECIES: beta-ketoacyl-ACP synthase [unclassified Mesorhizobium]TGT01451.1 beta-ketoacyl-ACP synthase [bacterium M00.F.Ca.ET.177.01.1.1]TGQ54211.1 beta-ketoacyl-ACP synthase [Mesorhizobium sp. M1C.F.Ca.ET.210.01.1.1]TGQ72224.1 beta-ketoacyl-ACP synthase [Mesorhizobium sp. M1C.F.Ca.ET.212.01.1.1]TGR10040.1 beta-ketoacyl-ACP synthase [Mesorhizobium sp. M1C.F.Ca.ET.204.01.1.1]TGR30160.1 beta-ketoacyl-ACP synthase [Mesorhizobium sp. M1C.F.Ca.ET.196.01.1.1]